MKLPWQQAEHRETDYTDAVIEHILANAQGEITEGLAAAVEVAAGWWQRAFASAEIQPGGVVANLLEPHLGAIGRALIVTGEIVFAIDTSGEGLTLIPASTVTVMGDPNPDSWAYKLTLPGPSTTITRDLPADRVVHLMYTRSRTSPWRGISPIEASRTTLELLSNLEQRLAEEAGQPVGAVIPVPNVSSAGGLLQSLRNLKGRLQLVETTNQGWGVGQGGVPTGDFSPRRIGGNPPEATIQLRRQVEQSILAACGVPVTTLGGSTDAASREGLRQFLHVGVAPVARDIAQVLSRKFGQEISFDWGHLWAADIQGRARSFQSMVGGGMAVEKAAALAGLMGAE